METLNLPLTVKVFKEGTSKRAPFVAYNPDLDVSSCGKTEEEAHQMLEKAVSLVLQEAKEDGTLEQVLEESGLKTAGENYGFSKTFFSVFTFPLRSLSRQKVLHA